MDRLVKNGDLVSVHYTGKLKDGTVFDSSIGKSTLDFEVGAGQMIAGFDKGVVGMKVGEVKTIEISPENAYGVSNPELVMTFDADKIPGLNEMEVGSHVCASNGAEGTITSKTDKKVTVDFNHQLAGKALIFEITMVKIR